jgi:hypothetical protein
MYLHIFKKILINTILFPQPIVYDRMRVQLQAVVAAADLLQEIHAAFVRSRGMLLKIIIIHFFSLFLVPGIPTYPNTQIIILYYKDVNVHFYFNNTYNTDCVFSIIYLYNFWTNKKNL